VFVGLLGAALLVIVGRLVELQVVHGEHYRLRAERSLLVKPKQLPFVRGSIVDRTGEVLVSDEPTWDLKVDYDVIAADVGDDSSDLKRAMIQWKNHYTGATSNEELEQAFRADLSAMWSMIAARFTSPESPLSTQDLRERARGIYDRVRRIREVVAARRGFDNPVGEETMAHAVLSGLDAEDHIAARQAFLNVPWVLVEPSTKRTIHGDATPFAHMLGRLGRVDADVVADDPDADDPFAKYQANELLGITGVEFAAEKRLRGRRGQLTEDRQGNLIEPPIEAEDGETVKLTLHAELQRRLYTLLGDAVAGVTESSGGAIVVLDIPMREVLALVSYPSYDPSRFDELYPSLRDDTQRLPLRFRAIANRYAPGSTIKPLVCLEGLMSGAITLQSTELCTGYLFDEHRDRWRCWAIHGTDTRMAHGDVNVVDALIGSCNVFMYRLGEKVGIDRLCSIFDMVGIGRGTGIGLKEEVPGVNPTPGWLMLRKNAPVRPGHMRNFAIGQGELSMTPLQVANLMATYASGRFRPVTLIRSSAKTPEWIIPATSEQWSAIRSGIYGVVNDPEGTAYKYARFIHDRYVICGKTGSATAHAWPTSYRIPYIDAKGVEGEAIVPAGAKQPAIDRFTAQYPQATFDPTKVTVAGRWPPHAPPEGQNFSHAWFGGYLQEVDEYHQPIWSLEPRIAFAVLVEFGGSGGRTSGPLAKRIAAELLEVLGNELDVDAPALANAYP